MLWGQMTYKPFSRAELQRLTIVIEFCIEEHRLFFIKKQAFVVYTQ